RHGLRRAGGRRPPGAGGAAGGRSRRSPRTGRDGRRDRPPARLRTRGRGAGQPARAGVPAVRARTGRSLTAITVRGLEKAYGPLQAVRGVDFDIEEGEVFGLLGPNGAGKTTTVEILEGYRSRDAGVVTVLGHDPERPGPEFRQRIGVVLQQSDLWPNLTVAEVHRAFAGYYRRPRNVDEVIELVGLAEKRDARVKTLSGGQKRR